jgi:hypothetical protein
MWLSLECLIVNNNEPHERIRAVAVNSLVEGKSIGDCFKNGIRDGAIGAITGGIVGGVAGGIDAAMDGRDFWSGKKWVEVNTGFGKTLSSSNVNFSDPKWDVEESMNLKQFSQGDDYTCTYRCKLSVDDYFGSTGQQSTNTGWLNYANNNNGVASNRIEGFYHMGGYSTNSFSGSMTPRSRTNPFVWFVLLKLYFLCLR